MNLLQVDTIDSAKSKIAEYCSKSLMQVETVSIREALGRVLAEDVFSAEMIPPYRRSTVDGFAVRSADVGAAGEMIPTILTQTGEILLGEDYSGVKVGSGQCVYVPTGGAIPEGADAMVMIEYCEVFGGNMIAVSKSAAKGAYVVQVGEDVASGDRLLERGRCLRAQDIGVLAAAGKTEIKVYRPWKVTVISTGDELVSPEETPGPGQIRDINSYTIDARSRAEGMEVVRMLALRDERDLLHDSLASAREDSDVVVVSGGSSQGKKDASAEMIGKVADSGVLTHGLAVKPGKPTITAFDSESGTLFIGLPGHPAAALMIYESLVINLWQELTGQKNFGLVSAIVTENIPSAPGRRTMQLVKLQNSGASEPDTAGAQSEDAMAVPVLAKSGMISAMSISDGYFEMSENQEGVKAGDKVYVHLWK